MREAEAAALPTDWRRGVRSSGVRIGLAVESVERLWVQIFPSAGINRQSVPSRRLLSRYQRGVHFQTRTEKRRKSG
ncbi:Hypothetical protein SMAX5B_016354 [Scophthalmus maximus]|uniref:Uncharacterized protein n=1 Tax=Scophthalmus maximus TaxID=52904 RepID=A0A2U9C5D0_SCOMX|nr:Hypothetical protein SMAX5B_016354 [Scophthalmus maximus]